MSFDIPIAYNHSYQGYKVEYVLTSEEIIKACNNKFALACSIVGKTYCIVFLPKIGPGGVGMVMQNFLKRWENARCNGWNDKDARVY